jgi:cell division protein FtsI/penicillin-binding protein 2
MNRQFFWRSMTVGILLAVIGLSIVIQIINIQTGEEAESIRDMASAYAYRHLTLFPPRGEIYDRKGHQLAGNRLVYEVGVDIPFVREPASIALAVSVYLGLDYNQIYTSLTQPEANAVYLLIQRQVPLEKAAPLLQLLEAYRTQSNPKYNLSGLRLKPSLQRSYPEKELGFNVIGFVSGDGRGYFGVEEKYNDLLAGQTLETVIPEDPRRIDEIPQPPNGASLILTLDRDLQSSVEQILFEALRETGAENGTIVLMDPRNGEILALASTPTLDLNRFWEYDNLFHKGGEFNRAVGMPYEPGSVFKILTMAAGLDTGKIRPETVYLDTGAIQVSGMVIRNWDKQAWGPQNMIGCLQHSLNTCLTWVALEIGPQAFYQYMQNFGIGHLTGVDIAGEAPGRLKLPGDGDWYPVELATNSFGQGVSVTPIQMLAAVSAVANDGKMVTPHVLYATIKNGHQYETVHPYSGSPISAQTARTLSQMLAISLEQEASPALVPGYRVAGKTGTAQIPPYDMTLGQTNASFIGWGPLDQPQVMAYIWLEKPTSSIWGSETAAPVFSKVMQAAFLLLDIPPDAVRYQVAGQ